MAEIIGNNARRAAACDAPKPGQAANEHASPKQGFDLDWPTTMPA